MMNESATSLGVCVFLKLWQVSLRLCVTAGITLQRFSRLSADKSGPLIQACRGWYFLLNTALCVGTKSPSFHMGSFHFWKHRFKLCGLLSSEMEMSV